MDERAADRTGGEVRGSQLLKRRIETEEQRKYWAFIDSVVDGYKRGKCPQCGNDSRPTKFAPTGAERETEK